MLGPFENNIIITDLTPREFLKGDKMWFWLHHSEAKYFGLILAIVLTATLILPGGCRTEFTNKPSTLTQAFDEQRPPEDLNVELTKVGQKFAENDDSKELPRESLHESISKTQSAFQATESGSALVDLVKKIQPAVVTIISFDKDNNPVGQGSGFFTSNNGHLITNQHVIEGAHSATVKIADGGTCPVAGILAADPNSDIVKLLVDTDGSQTPYITPVNIVPLVAEEIVVVGSPFGLESTVSRGIVSAIRKIPTFGSILQISAPISAGSSGSPVLNMKGQVIGVATFIIEQGQALNFAIPADKIKKLQHYANLIPFSNYESQREKDIFQRAKENLSVRQKSLLKKANAGDSDAMCQIGKMYLQGIGDFSKNEIEALKWFKLAADNKNTEAMYALSKLYLQNNFTEQDPNVSFNWLKKASEKDHIKSTLILSWIYKKEKEGGQFENFDFVISLDFDFDSINRLRKLEFPKSQKASETLFKKASSLLAAISEKDCKALNLGALFYRRREIFGQSNDEVRANKLTRKVAECYETEAEAGNYEAMYEIGRMYLWGTGVTQDSEIALKWLLRSAEAGNPEAIEYLGWVYQTGTYIEKDIEKATEWYKRTAKIWPSNGHVMYSLGSIYEKGEEIEQDYGQALDWYTKAANVGNVAAMISIGDIYRLGKGITEDSTKAVEWYKRALEAEESNTYAMVRIAETYSTIQGRENDSISWYERAAELNNSEAMFRLSKFYFDKSTGPWRLSEITNDMTKGLEEQSKKAFYWAQKVAENSNRLANPNQWKAQLGMAYFYFKGIGTEKDDSKALEWFQKNSTYTAYDLISALLNEDYSNTIIRKSQLLELTEFAARSGVLQAMTAMAMGFRLGWWGLDQNDEKAFQWYTKAAEKGESVAMYCLGQMYEEGEGVAKDFLKSMAWYSRAAEAGHITGMVKLGWAYYKTEDFENALKWFHKAAEQGNSDAMRMLGVLYSEGEGVPQDKREAIKWWHKAAESSSTIAMFCLGNAYENGEGVIQDYLEAFEWYIKGAEAGSAECMFSLGLMYSNGRGVAIDNVKAVEWWRKGAEMENASCMANLGWAYLNGKGVQRDRYQAIHWMQKSARLGNEYAKKILVQLDEIW